MKKLGVIGGLGPQATAYFMQLIVEMTDAATDQEHIPMAIYSEPGIPDRTKYIIGQSNENPLPGMMECGCRLVELQIDYIAVPCMTAHYFHRELTEGISVPIINGVEETIRYLVQNGVSKVGVLVTDGAIRGNIFHAELEKNGIQTVIPTIEGQKKLMNIIYQEIKASKQVQIESFEEIVDDIRKKGVQVILLGCTELSLLKRDGILGSGYLDAMEVLAKTSVELCGKLKPKYKQLIT